MTKADARPRDDRGTADERPTKERTRERMDDPRTLRDEVRQSLSLIAMTALTLVAAIAFGLLVGHLG